MGRFVTNRDDVEAGIRQGNWVVAFSQKELTETDALEALVAVAASVYTDQPEIVFGFLEGILDESIDGIEAAVAETMSAEVRSQIENFAIPYIKNKLLGRSPGESTETFGSYGVKAGLAQFIGHNEEWNPVANPGGIFGGDTGAWEQVGPGLVSYCPYVGIRFLSSTTPVVQHQRTFWHGTYENKHVTFRMEGAPWMEYDNNATTPSFTFAKTGADQSYVYLHDNSRDMYVALGSAKMYWRVGAGDTWNWLYSGGWS
jgi:hypothetical protein